MDVERIAAGLTGAQRQSLNRLCDRFVYVDGRSLRALVRRGLARILGRGHDALIGTFIVSHPTPLGLAVRQHLIEKGEG